MDLELCRKIFAERPYSTLYVGFSGGADSTAALWTAWYFSREYGFSVTAVHFDHHLRGEESDADARYCSAFAAKYGIPFIKFDLHLPPEIQGLENAARQERLKHWQQLAGNKKDCAVVLGHHGDDKIENFLLRMMRGSNLSGLLSPKFRTNINGVEFIRPLLCFSRKEIETFLLQQNISDWRTDRTNLIADCSRNSLRLEILPALYEMHPGAGAGIKKCLEVLELDMDFIETEAQKAFDISRTGNRNYWQALHPAIRSRVFRLWKNEIPTADFLQRFQDELQRPAPTEMRQIPWNDEELLVFRQNEVFWQKKKNHDTNEKIWLLTDEPQCLFNHWLFECQNTNSVETTSRFEAVFDADLLGECLHLALPCPGEKMTLFGSEKSQKIKKLRVDAKIPADWQLPVVKNGAGEIVWAPGIRHSAIAPVTDKTQRIIRLRTASAQFGIVFRID